jgi:Capsule polysaccharide biosynthesis protein
MFKEFFNQRIKRGFLRRVNNLIIARMAKVVARRAPAPRGQPVVFFKASTGIDDLSWNSGFHLLVSWGFRLRGVPVIFFACNAGMSRCVLGTDRDNPQKGPPCKACIYQSKTLYTDADAYWFTFERDPELENALQDLTLEELSKFNWKFEGHNIPLGELCLPGLRWILRIRNLEDNEKTRFLLREYICSAWNIAQKFTKFLDETNPRTVIVFNGQFFPEAAARWVAQKRRLRAVTHEVGLQPASAFFTEGEATAYPIHIPDEFELSADQNIHLDAYLEKRFQGKFSMAGIQFWPTMHGLDNTFLEKAARFKSIVPVFTNVIFDTSQAHADTVFADMFAWLEALLPSIRSHPEILFVIRAHPDETRIRKESRETVQDWLEDRGVEKLGNVLFVGPKESLSSYELIQRSKLVMVYNSTIGLEASIMGMPVLCAGKARFTQYPTVFFPQTVSQYQSKLHEFLNTGTIEVPPEFQRNARRFLYYQLFRTSLPFGDYLIPGVRATQARLKSFDLNLLAPERSPAIRAVLKGVLENGDFLLEE